MNVASASYENRSSEDDSDESDEESNDGTETDDDDEVDDEEDATEGEDDESTEAEDDESTEAEDVDSTEAEDDGNAIEAEDQPIADKAIDNQQNEILSSDGESEVCPVCLNKFVGQELGSPENCNHTFCLECLTEWSKNTNTCPIDRNEFSIIFAKFESSGRVTKKIPVKVRPREPEDALPEDTTACEVCQSGDREHRLLLCDACDLAYHCECLDPPLFRIPTVEWFCPPCTVILNKKAKSSSSSSRQRVIPRTIVSETVRLRIQRLREASDDSDIMPTPVFRPPVQRKKTVPKAAKRKFVRRRRRRKTTKKTVVLARTKQSVVLHGKTRVRVSVKTPKRRRRKVRRRRTTKRTVRSKKSLLASRPLAAPSTQQRIAERLGLCKPPTGHKIPYVKKAGTGSASSSKTENLPSLRLFGSKHQLMDFSEDFSNEINLKRKVPAVKCNPGPSTATSFDILGNIMAEQSILHHTKDITICKDGSLKLEVKAPKPKPEPVVKKEASRECQTLIKKEASGDCSTVVKSEASGDCQTVVKKEKDTVSEENIATSSNEPETSLIKNEMFHAESDQPCDRKRDIDLSTFKSKYRDLDREPNINLKVSKENNAQNHKIKIEKRDDFVHTAAESSERRGGHHSSHRKDIFNHGNETSLGTTKISETENLTYAAWRKLSPEARAQIKKEKSSGSMPRQISHNVIKTENRRMDSRNEHSSSSKRDVKSVSDDALSKRLTHKNLTEERLNRRRLENQRTSSSERSINQHQENELSDDIARGTKSPPVTYRNLDDNDTSDDLNRHNRTKKLRKASNAFEIEGDTDDRISYRKNADQRRDPQMLANQLSSSTQETQRITNKDIKTGKNLTEVNGRCNTSINQVREMENSSNNDTIIKAEPLSPFINDNDGSVNESSSSSEEDASSCTERIHIKSEPHSPSVNDGICVNGAQSPSQKKRIPYNSKIKIKVEPPSPSMNEDDTVISKHQNPLQERRKSTIENVNVKIEPSSSPMEEEEMPTNECHNPSRERRNPAFANAKIKIEPLSPSKDEKGTFGNANIKIEPPSSSEDEEDTLVNKSRNPPEKRRESCNSTVNIKIEPASPSMADEETFINTCQNSPQERRKFSNSNVNIKIEPSSPSMNKEDVLVNKCQNPPQKRKFSNNNMNIKIEPSSPSVDEEDIFVNKCQSPPQKRKKSCNSTVNIKIEPSSPSKDEDDMLVNKRQNPPQEKGKSCDLDVNTKIELSSPSVDEDKLINQSWNLSQKKPTSYSGKVNVKIEPQPPSRNDDNVFRHQSQIPNEITKDKSEQTIKIKIEPLSPSGNEEDIFQFPTSSHETPVSYDDNVNIKTEPFLPSMEDEAFINKLPNSYQAGEISYNDHRNIKIETPSEIPKENILGCTDQSSNLKTEKNIPSSSLNDVFHEHNEHNDRSDCVKTPNSFEKSNRKTIREPHSKKRNVLQDDDEVSIIFEKEISRKRRKIIKEEKNSFQIKQEKNELSLSTHPINGFSTNPSLNLNTVSIKSEIVSPKIEFASIKNNETDSDCDISVVNASIKMEPIEMNVFVVNDDDDSHDLEFESKFLPSDEFLEVTKAEESVVQKNISDLEKPPKKNLRGIVQDFFSKKVKLEKDSCKLEKSCSGESFAKHKKGENDSAYFNGPHQQQNFASKIKRKTHSLSSDHQKSPSNKRMGSQQKRTFSESESRNVSLRQSDKTNVLNLNIDHNNKLKNSDLSIVKVEGLQRKNAILHGSGKCQPRLRNVKSKTAHRASNDVNSGLHESSFEPAPRVKDEKYLCSSLLHDEDVCNGLENNSSSSFKNLASVGDNKIKIEKRSPLSSPNSTLNVDLNVVKPETDTSVNDDEINCGNMKSKDPISSGSSYEDYSPVNALPLTDKKFDRKPLVNGEHSSGSKAQNICDMNQKNTHTSHEQEQNGILSEDDNEKVIKLKLKASKVPTEKVMSHENPKKSIESSTRELKLKVEKEIKRTLWPFYKKKKISKQMHYDIFHKSLNKIMMNCNKVFDPEKIKKLVKAYVIKMTKFSNAK